LQPDVLRLKSAAEMEAGCAEIAFCRLPTVSSQHAIKPKAGRCVFRQADLSARIAAPKQCHIAGRRCDKLRVSRCLSLSLDFYARYGI
jgi:hypothetical protein